MAYIEPKIEEITEETSTLKIGEKEYTQEEVEALVTRANEVAELESKYNTKVDKVWPEYGRSQNINKELEAELEALKAQATQPAGDLDENSIAQAREQAKKLGIVTQDDFSDYLNKNFRAMYNQERQAERMIEDGKRYEKEIDGKDGRPKFDLEDILAYMAETGHKDLMKAYKDKFDTDLDKWKLEQLKKEKGEPFITQESGIDTDRQPAPIKATDDNIYKLVSEGLGNY